MLTWKLLEVTWYHFNLQQRWICIVFYVLFNHSQINIYRYLSYIWAAELWLRNPAIVCIVPLSIIQRLVFLEQIMYSNRCSFLCLIALSLFILISINMLYPTIYAYFSVLQIFWWMSDGSKITFTASENVVQSITCIFNLIFRRVIWRQLIFWSSMEQKLKKPTSKDELVRNKRLMKKQKHWSMSHLFSFFFFLFSFI